MAWSAYNAGCREQAEKQYPGAATQHKQQADGGIPAWDGDIKMDENSWCDDPRPRSCVPVEGRVLTETAVH
jgi:hypothetical protein